MKEPISPISAEMKLARLLGDDFLTQAPEAAVSPTSTAAPGKVELTGNPFDDMLAMAIDKLDGVNRSELYANQLIDKYLRGEADLQQVMVAQSKTSIMVNLAVTVVTSAVNTFKEITQMQI